MPTFSLDVARQAVSNRNYSLAMANYIAVLRFGKAIPRSQRDSIKDEFLDALVLFTAANDTSSSSLNTSSICEYYALAADLFQNSARVQILWGQFLFSKGLTDEASVCFMNALRLDPGSAEARSNLENLQSHDVHQWHFRMLNDAGRNRAYQQAIDVLIGKCRCPGSADKDHDVIVLDIGCGSGLLSAFAAKSGAKVVACEEERSWSAIAEGVITDPGNVASCSTGNVTIIQKHSSELVIPYDLSRSPDIIVTELMDAGFFGEAILTTLLDAHERLASPRTLICPAKAILYAGMIESAAIRLQNSWTRNVKLSDTEKSNVSLISYCGAACSSNGSSETTDPYAAESLQRCPTEDWKWMSEPVEVISIDFQDVAQLRTLVKAGLERMLSIPTTAPGHIDALIVWFEVTLADGITLSSYPSEDYKGCWDQAMYPNVASQRFFERDETVQVLVKIKDNCMRCCFHPEANPSTITGPDDTVTLIDGVGPIAFGNCGEFVDFYLNSCRRLSSDCSHRIRCLDVTNCLLLSLRLLEDVSCQHTQLTCAVSSETLEGANAANFLNRRLVGKDDPADDDDDDNQSIKHRFICKKDLDHLSNEQGLCFDHLLVVPFHWDGLFRTRIFEDVAYYCLSFGINQVIPARIRLMTSVVESLELVSLCQVRSNDVTLGVNIQDYANRHRATVITDLDSTRFTPDVAHPDCRHLTTPTSVIDVDLREFSLDWCASQTNDGSRVSNKEFEVKCIATADGKINAVLLWCELMDSHGEVKFSMSDTGKVVAYMADNRPILQGQQVLYKLLVTSDGFLLDFPP